MISPLGSSAFCPADHVHGRGCRSVRDILAGSGSYPGRACSSCSGHRRGHGSRPATARSAGSTRTPSHPSPLPICLFAMRFRQWREACAKAWTASSSVERQGTKLWMITRPRSTDVSRSNAGRNAGTRCHQRMTSRSGTPSRRLEPFPFAWAHGQCSSSLFPRASLPDRMIPFDRDLL